MSILPVTSNVENECERVLRSLPLWFGQEAALRDYVKATSTLPTFISAPTGSVDGFVTLKQHFPQSFEVTCIAVHASHRGNGVGRALLEHAASWAVTQGGRFLQVKTIAATHPSPEYSQSREFYAKVGFTSLEVFPTLWSAKHPCLQLIKVLQRVA